MTRVEWWSLSDADLWAQCEWDRYRSRGPGGQKRNKTDSSVRLRHLPTGTIVIATESRSQHENRRRAVRRLREALAYQCRQPITAERLESVPDDVSLAVRPRDERFLPLAARLLDLLDHEHGQVSSVAERSKVSTAQLVDFFRTTPGLWQAAQRIRLLHGQRPLR